MVDISEIFIIVADDHHHVHQPIVADEMYDEVAVQVLIDIEIDVLHQHPENVQQAKVTIEHHNRHQLQTFKMIMYHRIIKRNIQ